MMLLEYVNVLANPFASFAVKNYRRGRRGEHKVRKGSDQNRPIASDYRWSAARRKIGYIGNRWNRKSKRYFRSAIRLLQERLGDHKERHRQNSEFANRTGIVRIGKTRSRFGMFTTGFFGMPATVSVQTGQDNESKNIETESGTGY